MYKIGVLLSGQPNNGGSYQFWLAILKALSELDKNKYDVEIYSRSDEWIALADTLAIKHLQLKPQRGFVGVYLERAYRKFHFPFLQKLTVLFDLDYNLVQKERPNIFLAQYVDGFGDILKIPSIVPIFDLMHRYERRFAEVSCEYEAREILFRHQCETAEIILADSDVGKKQIIESYGEVREELEKHVEILPFIPPDYIYNINAITHFPYELFDKYIFYPAQFWTHKNHNNLIEALAKLKTKGLEINLILVGSEQNNRKCVEELIREKGLESNVKILGYVTNEEMVYLYQHARALVMPTYFGPTNIPQLEAFELGCPVATSGIYGIPNQVGDAALLFHPDSVEEIADCIEKLWNDDILCKELIQRGKNRAMCWGQEQFNCKFKGILDNYFEQRNTE